MKEIIYKKNDEWKDIIRIDENFDEKKMKIIKKKIMCKINKK